MAGCDRAAAAGDRWGCESAAARAFERCWTCTFDRMREHCEPAFVARDFAVQGDRCSDCAGGEPTTYSPPAADRERYSGAAGRRHGSVSGVVEHVCPELAATRGLNAASFHPR